jgi:hypothetical protein
LDILGGGALDAPASAEFEPHDPVHVANSEVVSDSWAAAHAETYAATTKQTAFRRRSTAGFVRG